jgi:hypothetical protein
VVECTVLPMGDGKVSMGQHVGGLGEAHYEEGETFTVPLPIALASTSAAMSISPAARRPSLR